MEGNLKGKIQSVQLETTSRCSLNCRTCLKPAYKDTWLERDMGQTLFNRILTQLPLNVSVHLQGWGDPLLHKDTLKHIEQLKNIDSTVSFTTNGTNTSLAEALIASGLDGLSFSMAGNNSTTQDRLRGEGSFSLLQKSIRTFTKVRARSNKRLPFVAVSYLLTPETIGELPGAVGWCKKNGVDAFATVHLTQAGCLEQQRLQFMLSREQARRYALLRMHTQLRALFCSLRLSLKEFHPTLRPICDKNPLNSIFINATGDVSPCVFLCPPVEQGVTWYKGNQTQHQEPLIFGNLKNMSLLEIWEQPVYQKFRTDFRRRQEFHDKELAGIGYSFAGSTELDSAVKRIKQYFSVYPAPEPCKACAKLDGY